MRFKELAKFAQNYKDRLLSISFFVDKFFVTFFAATKSHKNFWSKHKTQKIYIVGWNNILKLKRGQYFKSKIYL